MVRDVTVIRSVPKSPFPCCVSSPLFLSRSLMYWLTASEQELSKMNIGGRRGWDELEEQHWHTYTAAAAAAKSLQSCPTLCDPIDGSPPGSPVLGILRARTLGWVAISFSNAGKWKVKVKTLSHVRLLVTPWTAAYQAPPSMGFSRQQYWSGVPLPSPNKKLVQSKMNKLIKFKKKKTSW